MKLKKACITNFRCIDDSTTFSVGDVTCLVGKNESGKTSVLQALARLNPVDEKLKGFDKYRDYPRRLLTDFNKESRVLETHWSLDEEDIIAVEAVLGPGSFDCKEIKIEQTYDSQPWDVRVNEIKVVEWLVSQSGCDAAERQEFSVCADVAQ